MKKILFALLFVVHSGVLSAMSGTAIVRKSDRIFRVRTSLSVSTMTITTSSGRKRIFLQWGMNMANRSLSKFASGFVRGMTILSVNDGDQIWVYFRSSGRTRRLASHAKNASVAGSDFSYNDISNTAYAKRYYCRLLGTEGGKYKLRLTPKRRGDSRYSKLTVWIRKDNFVPERTIYFNRNGEKFKEMRITDVRRISGILTPMRITMKNLNSGSETVVVTKKIRYLSRLRRSFFRSGGLSRSVEVWKAAYPFFQ